MSSNNRNIKLNGIIIRKVPFKETSVILDVFTNDLGIIPIMAKGIRKEKNKTANFMEIMNEMEFVLYKNPSSDWYILKSSELIKAHLFEVEFRTGILMQAVAEICRQLIIPEEDSEMLYELFRKYLKYIKTVKVNGIAIFWRFLLKLFIIMGIEFNISECVLCKKIDGLKAYYPQKHGFICESCYRSALEKLVIRMTKEQSELFRNLKQIGKMLDEITITKESISQINKIFLIHLSEHFHKKFHLKSLEMYKV